MMYDDPNMESDSIMGWLSRRSENATSSLELVGYIKKFDKMWVDSFGNIENIPIEFKEKIKGKLKELQTKEGGGWTAATKLLNS